MTEQELHDHICAGSENERLTVQPPYSGCAFPVHPDTPVDYEKVRSQAYWGILGNSDVTFHPTLGAPHVDVHRFPPTPGRPFWCYVTSGMSDFPQVLPDGSTFRSELMCASSREGKLPGDLLHVLGTMPFQDDTFLHYFHTVPFPEGIGDPRFTYAMTVPPFLCSELAKLDFLGNPLVMMMVIRITAEEQKRAVRTSSEQVVENLPDVLDTWLIDGRGGGDR